MKTKISATILFGLAAPAAVLAACNMDPSDYRSGMTMGAPGPIKIFHVTGKHQCQSRTNMGYWADVELRDATDCTAGHSRLRMENPCGYYNGQKQDMGMSIGYTPGKCTPLF